MTMKKIFIFVPVQTIFVFFFVPVQQYKYHVRSIARSGVCPQRRPHAQQQLARDLEVERAALGQRCRPQSFGEVQRCTELALTCMPQQCNKCFGVMLQAFVWFT